MTTKTLSASDYPSPLIYKLSEFYRLNPDYKTSIVDIAMLARIVHTEIDKFIKRPHKQVTELYFDREPPTCRFV